MRDGVIDAIGPRSGVSVPAGAQEIAATDKIAVPGFVDVHIHGAGGHDIMEGTPEAISAVAQTIAAHGTTSFVATTVTASPEATCRSVEGISKFIAAQHATEAAQAEVLGIHFEGPFISPFGAACTRRSGSSRHRQSCWRNSYMPPEETLEF
jgi:N-acetylglucosamine-6-phosphate deacetylase